MTNLEEIATLSFRDLESGDEGVIVIRVAKDSVALAVSLQTDGDIEVLLSASDALAAAEKLRQAGMKAETHRTSEP